MADLDGIEDDFRGWEWWRGIGGLYYARRRRSSPPVVLRAATMDELKDKIREYLGGR